MGLFRRRQTGLSFDLLTGKSNAGPSDPVSGEAEVRGHQWIAPRSGQWDDAFNVSGVMHRQDALARAGSGQQLFRLLRDPTNPHDSNAVKVMAGDVHIGFITAKTSARYCAVIAPLEARGLQVFVHGQIQRQANQHVSKWIAMINCPFPDDWPV